MKIDKLYYVFFALFSKSYAKISNDFRMKQLFQDENLKETMKNIEEDMNNIMDAKDNENKQDVDAALASFYYNRKTLKGKGVDDIDMKYLDDEVDKILNGKDEKVDVTNKDMMTQLLQDVYLGETMKNIKEDMDNIMEAKNNKNRKDIDASLSSFFNNRKTLRGMGVDVDIMNYLDDKVDGILSME